MGQKCQMQQDVAKLADDFCSQVGREAPPRIAFQGEREAQQNVHEGREQKQGKYRKRPLPHRISRDPARYQKEDKGDLGQTAAQIIKHLPSREPAERVRHAVLAGNTEQPTEKLPIAPGPTMFSPAGRLVCGRIVFHQLSSGKEAGADMFSLDQVVAENRVIGEPFAYRSVEGGYIVDSFSRKAG